MSIAYELDSFKTFSLLENPMKRPGGLNLMELARQGDLRRVIASEGMTTTDVNIPLISCFGAY